MALREKKLRFHLSFGEGTVPVSPSGFSGADVLGAILQIVWDGEQYFERMENLPTTQESPLNKTTSPDKVMVPDELFCCRLSRGLEPCMVSTGLEVDELSRFVNSPELLIDV